MEPLGLVGNGLKDATDTVKATWWASVMERLQLTCGQLETLWSACEEEAGRQAPWDSDAQRAWGSSNFVRQRWILKRKKWMNAKGDEAALRAGQSHRATCSTAVHGCSSRSHLVMMLYLVTSDATTGAQRRLGRLSLVDLAGSERIKSSEATGDRLREAQHINRSLSALADVIVAKEKGGGHVPYRNSKLTHLLQDALGGQQNSRTAIVVALPPTWSSLGETLHSLQLSSRLNSIAAQRSRQTSLVWPLASVADEEAFAMARHEADRLRLENAQMRARLLQLEERDKERERELLELKQKVEAGLLLQASLESRRTFCSSPPSPVPEADSSQEKSFAESEKAVAALETSATSPLPDGLQPEPELQPADDFDELTRGSLEARALDFTGSFADVGFTDTGTSERPAEEEGPEQNWKWADPKDTSLQLQFLPSPVRSRRSSVAGEEGASPKAQTSLQLQDASDSQVEEKQDPATAEEVAADRNGGDWLGISGSKYCATEHQAWQHVEEMVGTEPSWTMIPGKGGAVSQNACRKTYEKQLLESNIPWHSDNDCRSTRPRAIASPQTRSPSTQGEGQGTDCWGNLALALRSATSLTSTASGSQSSQRSRVGSARAAMTTSRGLWRDLPRYSKSGTLENTGPDEMGAHTSIF
eukprot:s4220_g2.t4